MPDNIKILLVEDDPDISLRMEALIFSLDYQLLKAVDNSEEAIQVARDENPDVMVMDIDIKGDLNGIEVVEALRDLQIPVIFTTGYREEEIYEKARKTQPAAYLVKPFNKFTFQTALENAVLRIGDRNMDKDQNDPWAGEIWLKDSFFIKRNNLLQKVNVSDIQYIQADGNYCDIISSKKFAIKSSLTQLLKKLPANRFMRIHKSYVIQADLIENIDISSNQIYIQGTALPIGPKFKEEILKIAQKL